MNNNSNRYHHHDWLASRSDILVRLAHTADDERDVEIECTAQAAAALGELGQ